MKEKYTFLHGSRERNLTNLSLDKANKHSPFGPVIYCTTELDVAGCYTGFDGLVYKVTASGFPDRTINLDLTVEEQTSYVREKFISLHNNLNSIAQLNVKDNARDSLDKLSEQWGKETVNQCLSALGIWMIYGHLSGMEVSGLMDKGVQYGLLHHKHILEVTPHEVPEPA